MGKSRKQRQAEQRRLRTTLEQTKNRLAKSETETRRARQRADAAAARAATAVKLPDGLLEDYLNRAVSIAARELAGRVLDFHSAIEQQKRELLGQGLLRRIEPGYVEARDSYDVSGTHLTFDFPAFRWTHFFDRAQMEDMFGRAGPIFMDDRPIQYTRSAPMSMRLDTPDARTYRDDISFGVL